MQRDKIWIYIKTTEVSDIFQRSLLEIQQFRAELPKPKVIIIIIMHSTYIAHLQK